MYVHYTTDRHSFFGFFRRRRSKMIPPHVLVRIIINIYCYSLLISLSVNCCQDY